MNLAEAPAVQPVVHTLAAVYLRCIIISTKNELDKLAHPVFHE